MIVIFVGLGGAIGAILRYGVGVLVATPLATLTVNVIGSFLIGVVWVMLAQKGFDRASAFLITGVLGGFTTFSAFSLDALRLFESGKWGAGAGYITVSVLCSLLAIFLAVIMTRAFST